MMHHILLVRNAVLGASASLPFFEGPNHGLEESPSLEAIEHPVARPNSAPGEFFIIITCGTIWR